MKIRKTAKKVAQPLPEVSALIERILACSDDDIPTVLQTVPDWPWPRGDLHSWIKVLNRFDGVLEQVVAEYNLKDLQVNDFTPRTRTTVLEILRFEKLLLERCTSRKVFASYDHLADLLATQDVDVLVAALRLLLRPAQQYQTTAHSPDLAPNSLIVKRLLSLAHGWGPAREAGFDLARLASDSPPTEGEDDEPPAELGEVVFQFYRRPPPASSERLDAAAVASDVVALSTPDTPTQGPSGAGAAAQTPTPAGSSAAYNLATSSSSFQPPATFGGISAPVASSSNLSSGTNADSTLATPVRPKPKSVASLQGLPPFKTPTAGGGSPSGPNSSGPSSSTVEGLTTVVLGNVNQGAYEGKSAMAVLADVVEMYDIPEKERFELHNLIRIAKGLRDRPTRRMLVWVRCLAVATYCHLVPESVAQTDLFLYEPDIVQHIAQLVHVEVGVAYDIQAAAIFALDALSRYRSRIAEVISAVNASANHGVLMSLFRNMTAKLAEDSVDPPADFVDGLASIITYLINSPAYSNMIVGSGIVPLLVQILQIELPSRLPFVVKAINLIDHVVYSNSNGFNLFCNAGGLEALTRKIQTTTEDCIAHHSVPAEASGEAADVDRDGAFGRLPFKKYTALKALLRSISRMMQSSGTADGLRNLIDSTLPATVKEIILHRRTFGPVLFATSLSVMATFVHNEPTSLTVLQEKGLPEAFYNAVDDDIEASIEVLYAVPNVIGALCLNQAGLDQLAARQVTIVPKMVSVLVSDRHRKVLEEKEHATQLGAYVDELIRHQPSLKEPVLKAVLDVLARIKELGQVECSDDETVYHILPATRTPSAAPASELATPMDVVATADGADSAAAASTSVVPTSAADAPAAAMVKADGEGYSDNRVVLFIGVTARFLEGLFHNHTHCKEFIKSGGLERLLDLYALPCVPYDFAGSAAADSLFALFRAVSDVNPNAVLQALLKPVRQSLNETRDLWDTMQPTSKLSPLTDLEAGPELDAANATFRRLICLHGRVALLADMYRGVGFSHSKVATGFLQILNTPEETQVLLDLGRLHRACVWENILIKSAIPDAVVSIHGGTKGGGPEIARGQTQTVAGVPEDVLEDINAGLVVAGGDDKKDGQAVSGDAGVKSSDTTAGPSAEPVKTRNGKAFKYLISQLPASLTPFFQAVLKFLMFKRGNDAAHRKQAHKTADTLASMMLGHFDWAQTPEPALDPVSKYAYGTLIIGFTSVLLFDERPMAQGSLQMMLLTAFAHRGGIDAIVKTASNFSAAFDELDPTATTAKLEQVHVFSGLKVALGLLQSLVSTRVVFDSPQTAQLTSRDKPTSSEDYFDPHQFLVRLRLAILPFVRNIWQSSWLLNAPVAVARSVIHTILSIMDSEPEIKPAVTAAPVHISTSQAAPGVPVPRPPPPPERIQQLVDMGFSAHAATEALRRCHNNTSFAAEFLLTHPGAFAAPPPPPPAAAPAAEPAAESSGAVPAAAAAEGDAAGVPAVQPAAEAAAQPGADVDMADDSPEALAAKEKEQELERAREKEREACWEDRRPQLNEARKALTGNLCKRALELADRYESLVYDIKPAFVNSTGAIESITKETAALISEAFATKVSQVNVRLRLLSLILHDGPPSLVAEKDLAAQVMDLVLKLVPAAEDVKTSRPVWLPSQLHVAEALLILTESLNQVDYLPADVATDFPASVELFQGPAFNEARSALFEQCLALLPIAELAREEFASALRLLVILTRDYPLALDFARRGGVGLMLGHYKAAEQAHSGCQAFIAIILRHIVESPDTLREIMRRDVRQWFSSPRTKVVDINHFIKNNRPCALRNPRIFREVVAAECVVLETYNAGVYHIMLKTAAPTATESAAAATAASETSVPPQTDAPKPDAPAVAAAEAAQSMQVDGENIQPPDFEVIESVVHHLLSELMAVGKQATHAALHLEPTPAAAGTSPVAQSTVAPAAVSTPAAAAAATPQPTDTVTPAAATAAPPATASKPQDSSDYVYACLLMQNLTELLGSYMSCKAAFLTMGKKRGGKESLFALARPRTAILNFMLLELVCCTGLADQVPPTKPSLKKAMDLANCAMTVLVALCSDVGLGTDLKDTPVDLVAVRKVVLDALSKAIKDATSSAEHVDVRYGRLHSLSDLCYRLLTARPNIQPKGQEDGSLHIAKVMLEKNFAVALTNALAEVDLNYPDVKLVVLDILKPLEHLTKISIKMGRASDKKKDTAHEHADVHDASSTSSAMMDEDDDSEGDVSVQAEEETPDLYRNSALGMYGGEMEDMYDEDSEAGEEEDFDEMDELDGMTEGPTDSGTDTGSEDDEDESGMEDDLIADEDDWDDEDGEEDEEGIEAAGGETDGDEEEMMYDPDGDDMDGMHGMDMDEMDEMGEDDMPLLDEDGEEYDPEDEDDIALSELVEAGYDMPMPSDNGGSSRLTNWGWQQTAAPAAGDQGDSVRRIARMPDPTGMQAFSAGAALDLPLPALGDGFEVARPMPAPRVRGGLPMASATGLNMAQLSAGGAGGVPEIISTIDNLIGDNGAAIRLLEQLVARSHQGGHGGETIRIGLASAAAGGGPGPIVGGFSINRDGVVGRHGDLSSLLEGRPGSGAHRDLSTSSKNEFVPLPTTQRWLDEERITQGRFSTQRIADLTIHVVNALLPAAREAVRKAKEADAVEEERSRKQAEEDAAKAAAQTATEAAAAAAAAQPSPEAAAATASPAPAAASGATAPAQADSVPAPARPIPTSAEAAIPADVSMADPADEPVPGPFESAAEPSTASGADVGLEVEIGDSSGSLDDEHIDVDIDDDDGDDDDDDSDEGSMDGDGAERITITIHGEEVDITDTGIDITFLEALPDDMREEVLNQHFRERRPAPSTANAPTEINSEFLDALPPDIRAEVLQQEAVEQSRRDREAAARAEREAAQAAGAPAPQAAELDPASFLQSLDPELRNQVLMEQEEDFLQSLPGDIMQGLQSRSAAQAAHRRFDPAVGGRSGQSGEGSASAGGAPAPAPKKPPPRDAIQLLEKSGIASLVRLLFFPEVSRKSTVPRVLVNLCENSKTRFELLNMLLTVVQDGTGDLSAVDKSFAQMSIRAGKGSATPKATPKKKGVPETPGPASLFSHLSAESVPTFIAQRCFDALYQIVISNEQAPLFFLTEHDVLVGLKRPVNRKAKGKERQIPQTKYPLVILLGLLDRPALLKNTGMMESLTSLLVSVTRPLTALPTPAASEPAKESLLATVMASISSAASSASAALAPAPATPANTVTQPASAAAADAAGSSTAAKPAAESAAAPVLSHPPQVPNNVLRLVVNILTIGDVSSATFKAALTLINHLSHIPDAKEVITAEIRSQAQDFGNVLQTDLEELSRTLQTDDEHARAATIAKFTPASSTQAKLLRVLKTLEHMYTIKPVGGSGSSSPAAPPTPAVPIAPITVVPASGGSATGPASAPAATGAAPAESAQTKEQQVNAVYESFDFGPLWQRLGECLAIVDSAGLNDVATVLLPIIESLMVVCKYVGTKADSGVARGSLSPRSPAATLDSTEDLFLRFTDAHRKILNVLVRNNPSLMSGSFALLVQNPKILEFDNKRNYFTQQLRRRPNREAPSALQVNVRREHVFEDSFSRFQRWTPEQIKYGKLNIRFFNEEGVDAGGVSREWFSVLAKSIFNPDFALFEPASSGALTYQFNRLSSINPDHLAFFKFVGVVLAKAVQDGRLLDAHFIRSVYRQLLGVKNMGLQDLETVDPSYHTSLKWMAENSIEDILELSFSVETDAFGVQQVHDLIPDGRNVAVTDENKMDYIQKIVNFRLADSIADQSKAFIEGFTSIIPQALLQIYDASELELLISGLPTIDIDELKNSVQLHGWRNSDPEIVWLWRALRSFSQAERAQFLQFTTGSARVPLGGFSQLVGSNGIQPVQVHRAHGDPDRIATSHTCFNQLDLGSYTSYETLRDKLMLAITEGAVGFGFA